MLLPPGVPGMGNPGVTLGDRGEEGDEAENESRGKLPGLLGQVPS